MPCTYILSGASGHKQTSIEVLQGMVGGQNDDRLDVLLATSRALPGPSAEAHGSGARERRPRPGSCERASTAQRKPAGTTAGPAAGTTVGRQLCGGAANKVRLPSGEDGGLDMLQSQYSYVLAQKGVAPFFAKSMLQI